MRGDCHFGNPKGLWRVSLELISEGGRRREPFGQGRAEVETLADPRERSRAFVRSFVRYSASHPEVMRLMIEEGKTRADRMTWLVDQYLRPMYEVFVGYGRYFGDRGGEGAAISAEMLPHAFYTMVGAASVIFTVIPDVNASPGSMRRPTKRSSATRNLWHAC